MTSHYSCDVARREVLRLGLYAGGLAALGVPMSLLGGIARAIRIPHIANQPQREPPGCTVPRRESG